jgi:NADH-quinone oxidoreductase subunit I
VTRKRELNFWEKIYLPEIIRGVALTSRHFFVNLFLHTVHLFGFRRGVRAGVTTQYPEEQRPLASRLRTRHRLTVREEGTPRCVGCMLCETVCPAKCITIAAGEHPDPNVEKYPVRFDIDLGVCVYCGYCVEACPEDAIRMDTEILDIAAYSREAMKLDIHELMAPPPAVGPKGLPPEAGPVSPATSGGGVDPKLRKPVAGCRLQFPHQCALQGQQRVGSWESVYGKKPEPAVPRTACPC